MSSPPPLPGRKTMAEHADRLAARLSQALISECRLMAMAGIETSRGSIIGGVLMVLVSTVSAQTCGDDQPAVLEKLVELAEKCLLDIAGVQIDRKLVVKESGTVQ